MDLFEIKEEKRFVTPDQKEFKNREKAEEYLSTKYLQEQLFVYFKKMLPAYFPEDSIKPVINLIMDYPHPLYNILQGFIHIKKES